MKDERVEIFIPRASDREDPNLFAAVNGVNYLLPRGKKSCVPKVRAYMARRRIMPWRTRSSAAAAPPTFSTRMSTG